MNNSCCNSKPLIVFSNMNSPFLLVPSQWDCKHRALRVEVWLCLAFSGVKAFSVHSEDLLKCEPGHSTPCLPSAWVRDIQSSIWQAVIAALESLCRELFSPLDANILTHWGWHSLSAHSFIICLPTYVFSPCIMVSGWCSLHSWIIRTVQLHVIGCHIWAKCHLFLWLIHLLNYCSRARFGF